MSGPLAGGWCSHNSRSRWEQKGSLFWVAVIERAHARLTVTTPRSQATSTAITTDPTALSLWQVVGIRDNPGTSEQENCCKSLCCLTLWNSKRYLR